MMVLIPSTIYDSIRPIKSVSVVFLWVTPSSTHYQWAVYWQNGWLFTFLSTNNQHKIVVCPYCSLEISKACGNGLGKLGSLVMCTVYTSKSPVFNWSLGWVFKGLSFRTIHRQFLSFAPLSGKCFLVPFLSLWRTMRGNVQWHSVSLLLPHHTACSSFT